MKILQTIQEFGIHKGGISTSTYELITAMRNIGSEVDILTLEIKDDSDKLIGNNENWIKVLKNDSITPYEYSKNFKEFLRISNYDIYHTNGLWLYCNHITCAEAKKKNKPYVISPHGMLYPAALKRSYWKKWPLIQLCFNSDIQNASCIHVTCYQELEYVRNFGYTGPIAIIPNLINFPNYLPDIIKDKNNKKNDFAKFGFLGRLHPIKKIENILYAAAKLPNQKDFEIDIIGSGDESYEQFLHHEVSRLDLKNVNFMGFLSDRDKFNALADLTCLFVPSDSENFGMIVTEALSVGTPVMASLGTPWEDLNTYRCGWWTDRDPDSIASIMKSLINMPKDKLYEMGENGIKLVNNKFSPLKVSSQMLELYNWLDTGDIQPEFVYYNK